MLFAIPRDFSRPISVHSYRVPVPVCFAGPCGEGASRRFLIMSAVSGCEREVDAWARDVGGPLLSSILIWSRIRLTRSGSSPPSTVKNHIIMIIIIVNAPIFFSRRNDGPPLENNWLYDNTPNISQPREPPFGPGISLNPYSISLQNSNLWDTPHNSSPRCHAAQWMERWNGQGTVTIGGRIAMKQMDENAGDTFMLARLNIISRVISPGRPGKIQTSSPYQLERPEFTEIQL